MAAFFDLPPLVNLVTNPSRNLFLCMVSEPEAGNGYRVQGLARVLILVLVLHTLMNLKAGVITIPSCFTLPTGSRPMIARLFN
jgi:hypothetical protein